MEHGSVVDAPAKIEPSVNGRPDRPVGGWEIAGMPKLQGHQALIADAARAAGLGPWIRYGASAECLYCSAEAAQVFGVEQHRAGTAFLEFWSFIHPGHRNRVARLMEAIGRDPRPYAIEYEIVLPSGETRYVAETAQPVFDETGKLTHFLGAFQDITDRRHPGGEPDIDDFGGATAPGDRRQTSRRDVTGERIRSLLDIIITSSELMLWRQEGDLPEAYRGYARDIRQSGMDLKLIIDELLAAEGGESALPTAGR